MNHLRFHKLLTALAVMLTSATTTASENTDFITSWNHTMTTNVNNLEKLAALYPKTPDEITQWAQAALTLAKQELADIINVKHRTFANTIEALDISQNKLSCFISILHLIIYCHPDAQMRTTAQETIQEIQPKTIELYINPVLYQIVQEYDLQFKSQETLSAHQELLLSDTLRSCKMSGLHLPEPQLTRFKELSNELATLEQQFQVNINNDNRTIAIPENELTGVSERFKQSLTLKDGMYELATDMPTYMTIMQECSNATTRKVMFFAKNNTAYPQNHDVLVQMLHKRTEKAKLLDHENYTAYDLSRTSAKNLETVEKFLIEIANKAQQKAQQELALLCKDLPEGVCCNQDGSLNQWDQAYAFNAYKKKYFAIDEAEIAQYLPIDRVLDTTFDIYQNFLGLKFKKTVPAWTWHEDVYLIEIYQESSGQLLGYLFLDLYPRPNKYGHACVMPQVMSSRPGQEQMTSVGVMITNFPKPTKNSPSLLKHNDAVTFFHEFGHAMHLTLGRTQYSSQAGFNVAPDFAEVPSQMFEQWMWQQEELINMSKHYQTGKQLDQQTVTKKIELRKANSGLQMLRQCLLALFCLRLMTDEQLSYQPDQLWQNLHDTYLTGLLGYEAAAHFYSDFGHLACSELYGAKYYCYMWTNVFAIDLFNEIKNNNFSDEYRNKAIALLRAGGSVPAETLLREFLGREPNATAFMKEFGLC